MALGEGVCVLGGNIFAKGLNDWGRRAVLPFMLYPDICLRTEEIKEKPQSL
jgi:hypothetical protein